jgi:hydroxyacylglutathione hydrolase
MSLVLKTFTMGSMGNNCYLVYDDFSKKAFIVDAPASSDEVREFIKKEQLFLEFILLTHGHFDHIADIDKFHVPFYIHPGDEEFLKDPRINASLFCGEPIIVNREPRVFDGAGTIKFDEYSIEIITTPGHTPGGVCYRLDNWLFSGDTLFYNSIGRTDIPLACHKDIISSIAVKLMCLPDDLKVFPGHGHSTTIGREKSSNPFL